MVRNAHRVKIIVIFTFKKVSKMKVEILEFVEGARDAKGVAVIIDVFRAFSVACYAVDAGAARIIATSEVSEAFQLKNRNTKIQFLLVKEMRKKLKDLILATVRLKLLKPICQVKL